MKRSTSCGNWINVCNQVSGSNVFNEQRQAQRKVLKVKALMTPEGRESIPVRTIDIAANGMCVTAPVPLGAHAVADLAFELFFEGKANPYQIRAKVSYCILSGDEFKIGFQFVNLPLSSMTMLARYLR